MVNLVQNSLKFTSKGYIKIKVEKIGEFNIVRPKPQSLAGAGVGLMGPVAALERPAWVHKDDD